MLAWQHRLDPLDPGNGILAWQDGVGPILDPSQGTVSPLPPPVSPTVPTEADKINRRPGYIHNLCDPASCVAPSVTLQCSFNCTGIHTTVCYSLATGFKSTANVLKTVWGWLAEAHHRIGFNVLNPSV